MRSTIALRVFGLLVAGTMVQTCGQAVPLAANELRQVPDKAVVIIRDLRLQSAEQFAAQAKAENNELTDEEVHREYVRRAARVRQVQREQYSVIRRALQESGTQTIFIEQVIPDDLAKFTEEATAWAKRAAEVDEIRQQAVALQRSLELRRRNGETDGDFEQQQQELAKLRDEVVAFGMEELRLGVSARLLASENLDIQIKTVETQESLDLLQTATTDADDEDAAAETQATNQAQREKLLATQVAQWLKENDVAVLILSGEVDLRDEFLAMEFKVQYGVATVPSFPK